jgi:hypothetical protein
MRRSVGEASPGSRVGDLLSPDIILFREPIADCLSLLLTLDALLSPARRSLLLDASGTAASVVSWPIVVPLYPWP